MFIFSLGEQCFSEFCVSGAATQVGSIPEQLGRCRQTLYASGSAFAELGFAAAAASAPNATEPTQPLCCDARAGMPKPMNKRARRSKHALGTRGNTC